VGVIDQFEAMLQAGQDSPLLRYGLGNEYLKTGHVDAAIDHLRRAVEQDPEYSAAWKVLGKAYVQTGRLAEAIQAFESGISVAEKRGDLQAVKEMRVFRKRAEKALDDGR